MPFYNSRRAFFEEETFQGRSKLGDHTRKFNVDEALGLAEVHRSDEINTHWIGSPAFGAGLNYNFTDHIMGEFGANYTAGKGKSELNPVEDYFPFIYSVFFRLTWRM